MKLSSNFLYLYRLYISERSVLFTRTISNLTKTTLACLETLIHSFSRGFNLNFIKLNLLGPPINGVINYLKRQPKMFIILFILSSDRS